MADIPFASQADVLDKQIDGERGLAIHIGTTASHPGTGCAAYTADTKGRMARVVNGTAPGGNFGC